MTPITKINSTPLPKTFPSLLHFMYIRMKHVGDDTFFRTPERKQWWNKDKMIALTYNNNGRFSCMSRTKAFVTGFIFGGLAAGSTVLLTTPKPGKVWRQDSKNRGIQLKTTLSQIKENSIALKNDILSASQQTVPAVKTASQDMKQTIAEWKKDIQPNVESIRAKIKDINKSMDQLEQETHK